MAEVLPVELTVGWPTEGQESVGAKDLHDLAVKSSGEELSYEEVILKQLQKPNYSCVDHLDQLLRRRKNGFSEINRFTATLLKIMDRLDNFKGCRMDIFAFAFLKYAKNYDLFMVASPANVAHLQGTVTDWKEIVQALEDFERLGQDLAPKYSHFKDIYLKLRSAVSRPSARDEQRTLAVLLGSGPSTLDEISIDLGLHYSLNQRIITTLQNTGAIESRDVNGGPQYFIKETALPVVLFLTRELIGLDFLTMAASLTEGHNG